MAAPSPADRSATVLESLAQLGGVGLAFLDASARPDDLADSVLAVGVHRSGARPATPDERFDILLTCDPDAPRPWVSLGAAALDSALADLEARAGRQPAAAATLAQVLRTSEQVPFAAALASESLAFSMLLGSQGFRAWRNATPRRDRPEPDRPRVLLSKADGVLHLELDRPGRRNAVDARMRDELCEALDAARLFPDKPRIVLSGRGSDFNAGGDLDEFGAAPDPGEAHLIRLLRSPAQRLHALADRAEARLQGACIGAGIEIPAAAGRVVARPGAWFRLPELEMGLIPGAGGTATLPRRIGRHRTCYMALSGARIDLETALRWGLVDEVWA